MLLSRFAVGMFSVGLMLPGAGRVLGQDFPNKPVRIVTSVAGGGNDFAARLIAPGLATRLGQPVIVDNKGSTLLSTDISAKALPDGYTLHVNGALLWIYPMLQKAPYDAIRDFSPVALISTEPSLVAVHPSVAVNSIKELIALAKARPGVLNYGSTAAGGATHLAVELFKSMAGVNIVNVPYKGSGPAITALLSGEVQLLIFDVGLLLPHAKSGKLRALAVTSAEPSALVPGLPTVAASGLPGYEKVGMTGIWAPAKTPAAVINRLNQEIVRVLGQPEVKERVTNAGADIVASSPEQFAATIRSDMARMGKVIQDAEIKVN